MMDYMLGGTYFSWVVIAIAVQLFAGNVQASDSYGRGYTSVRYVFYVINFKKMHFFLYLTIFTGANTE